jgi:hypothetical protein
MCRVHVRMLVHVSAQTRMPMPMQMQMPIMRMRLCACTGGGVRGGGRLPEDLEPLVTVDPPRDRLLLSNRSACTSSASRVSSQGVIPGGWSVGGEEGGRVRFKVGEWGNKRRGKPEPWGRQRHIRTRECSQLTESVEFTQQQRQQQQGAVRDPFL